MGRNLVLSANDRPNRYPSRGSGRARGLRGRRPTARRYGPDPRRGVSVNFGDERTDTVCRFGARSSRTCVNRRGEPADTGRIGF
jgi:hypothetical protein